ncbi:MAG TPA: aminotransferase class V-fold PLP-dependent enzyme [Burkholderiaceae bacterium]|nr:aminotransferase class V-fold PLP-dependent enzyme [Burkholderiaceae bacterium]
MRLIYRDGIPAHAATADAMRAVRSRIVGVGENVPVLGGEKRPYINFDNAASTPVLREVLATVNDFMRWYSSVHRGSGFKSKISSHAYDSARRIVCDFVSADMLDHVVIFGKNSSEAINKLAHRVPLRRNDVVLLSLLEHHSNDLPWRARCQVRCIAADAHGALDEQDYDRLLEQHKGRVKLVAITGASNVTGHVPDVHRLARKAHHAGAQILVDCAQLAPHRTVEMGKLCDPEHLDYISISAHKMYAPFGTGALVGRRDTFEQGEPDYRGGGTVKLVTLDTVDWADTPDRDEAGSPNVVGAVALATAMKQLKAIGMDAIAQHEAELTEYTLRKLRAIGPLRLYGRAEKYGTSERLGVIPFTMEGMSHFQVAAILSAEWGIGVRNGCFCAHPYAMRLLGVDEEAIRRVRSDMTMQDRRAMPGMVRISFGMYNTREEVDVLVEALGHIASGRYRGRYEQDRGSGEFHPVGWQPGFTEYFEL